MQFFITLQLSFLKKSGVSHKNGMLFVEIGLSTYNYTHNPVEVRAEVLKVGIFSVFFGGFVVWLLVNLDYHMTR